MTTWRLRIKDGRTGQRSLVLDASSKGPVSDLVAELEASGFHSKPISIDGDRIEVRDHTLTIGDLGLVHGSTITAGEDPAPTLPTTPGTYLVAATGPDAGGWWLLKEGQSEVIGRGRDASIVVNDRILSGTHARMTFRHGTVIIEDLDSTNGTYIEGEEIEQGTAGPGSYIQLGASVFAIVEVTLNDLAITGRPDGPEMAFPRRFRRAHEPLAPELTPPDAPANHDSAMRGGWWRALLPILSGVGFAVITGRWIFLLIVAISPLVIAFETLVVKRRRLAKEAEERKRYEEEQQAFEARLQQRIEEERRRRRDDGVAGGIANLIAATRHSRLWERAATDADFLSVPIGLATLPMSVKVRGQGDQPPKAWGTPLQVPLLTTGSVAVVGDIGRGRAIVRSMLMSLATTHASSDLTLWVLSESDTEAEWGFVQWLPHAYLGDHGARIATTDTDRTAFLKSLRQVIDNRAEDDSLQRGIALPIHVVVVDGTHLVTPAELAYLLGRGPAQGVIGLTIDQLLAPEGTKGTLTIGPAGDDSRFESHEQPLVTDLRTTELTGRWAENAARRLSPLRPYMDIDAEGNAGTVNLTDLLDLTTVTAEDIVGRWEALSPRSAAVVGSASGTPMVLDIAKDGPHGLVGGMSGSGKTEFLMTYLLSMCLNNHPDDLSIVIADFKGGVDHEHIRRLPHVIEVATNRNPAGFRRTVSMLESERERRQDLFTRAGVQNLTAYRAARSDNPSLPPVPMLLVVVDEFSELLASDEGKQHLKELESITRTGRALGAHLILVTQNFEENLPAQVDANAPMRVCLQVQKGSHSKVVLGSPIAATIPDSMKGRGYARFHGRDLVEFQGARVAGPRRDLANERPEVVTHIVPYSALPSQAPLKESGNVPVEKSDLWALLGAIDGAARQTGWHEPAVPWPPRLGPVTFDQLPAVVDEGVPIGVLDLPDRQAQEALYLDDKDEQVALIGSSAPMLSDTLTSICLAAALTRSPRQLHIYAIDVLGTGLAVLGRLPHCGAVASRNEARSLKILEMLTAFAAERRSVLEREMVSTVDELRHRTGETFPQIVLAIAGADQLLKSGEGDISPLYGPLEGLLAESPGTGIQVLFTGSPRLAASRLVIHASRRFVFQFADTQMYSAMGVRRDLITDLDIPRRCVDVVSNRQAQIVQFDDGGVGERKMIDATIDHLLDRYGTAAKGGPTPVFDIGRVVTIDPDTARTLEAPAGYVNALPFALDVGSGQWMFVDPEEEGPAIAVTGPPRSGRSTSLNSVAHLAALRGWKVWAMAGSRRSPLRASSPHLTLIDVDALDTVAMSRPDQPRMLVIDDAHRLPDEAADALRTVVGSGNLDLVLYSASIDFVSSRSMVRRAFPDVHGTFLLKPASGRDGYSLGLSRLADSDLLGMPVGRGFLILGGEATVVQSPLITGRVEP